MRAESREPEDRAERTPLLRAPEAAAFLGISVQTLARWRGTGQGPQYIRLSARAVAYKQSALEAWCMARSFQSTTQAAARDAALSAA